MDPLLWIYIVTDDKLGEPVAFFSTNEEAEGFVDEDQCDHNLSISCEPMSVEWL